jgi:hypothetical protein
VTAAVVPAQQLPHGLVLGGSLAAHLLPCRFPLLRPQPLHIGGWTFTLTKVDRLRVERTKAVVVETTRETTSVAVQVAAESGSRNVEYFFLSVVAQAV